MKKLLALLAATFMTAALAQVDVDSLDPSGQTVTFWHQHDESGRVDALDRFTADFNANNPYGITVEHLYQGGYGDIFRKMLPVLGTSSVPNLVVGYQNQTATYAVADGMVDMTPYVNSEKYGLTDEEKADFFQGIYQADVFPSFGNQRFGFPPNRSMEVIYYNIDWLEELRSAGLIDFDGAPSTPAEFEAAACAAAQQPFSGATSDANVLGFEIDPDASNLASLTFAMGGDIFDYENNEYAYDSPEAIEAMTFMQDLFNQGCAGLATERYGDQTNFGAGTTLFTIGSTSGLPFYQSAVDEGAQHEWSVSVVPHVTAEPVQNLYGASVGIPAGKSPEANLAAWLFLKYYTSPEVQADWAISSNYFPVRQSVAESMGDYFAANPTYEKAFGFLPYAKAEPPVPGYDFVRDEAAAAMVEIAEGADVTEVMSRLDEFGDIELAAQSQ